MKNLLLFTIVLSVNLSAQTWTKTFGGSSDDAGFSVAQTKDSGYIVTGYTSSFGAGNKDVYLVKTNEDGNCLFLKTFGGTDDEVGYSVSQTTDYGYIITGYAKSFGAGDADIYLVKTDSLGNPLWMQIYGGDKEDIGYSVIQSTDGGYVITGSTKSYGTGGLDVYLIKTDSIGDTLWTKTFGGIANDAGRSVIQAVDGGYVISGWITYYGGDYQEIYLIKTDSAGDTVWTRNFGGLNNDVAYSVKQTTDGGYTIAGWTTSYGPDRENIYIIKTDSNGDSLWANNFGGNKNDYGQSTVETSDSGFVVAGYTNSYTTKYDVCLIKFDKFGNTLWSKSFGANYDDYGYSVKQTSDKGYIITGAMANSSYPYCLDVCLIKTDSLGNTKSSNRQ